MPRATQHVSAGSLVVTGNHYLYVTQTFLTKSHDRHVGSLDDCVYTGFQQCHSNCVCLSQGQPLKESQFVTQQFTSVHHCENTVTSFMDLTLRHRWQGVNGAKKTSAREGPQHPHRLHVHHCVFT